MDSKRRSGEMQRVGSTSKVGKSKSSLRADGVLVTVFNGHVNADVINATLTDVTSLLEASIPNPLPFWLVDATEVTYDRSIMDPARDLIGHIKKSGRTTIVAIIKSGLVRMIATTLCYAASIDLKTFEYTDDAESHILNVGKRKAS